MPVLPVQSVYLYCMYMYCHGSSPVELCQYMYVHNCSRQSIRTLYSKHCEKPPSQLSLVTVSVSPVDVPIMVSECLQLRLAWR